MNHLIEEKRQELERVCQRRVHRIELFGSAVRPDFDTTHSDLDFVVSFKELDLDQYADAYFGLLEDLQALFQRPVDLVVSSAIQNPYFREAVDSSRHLSMRIESKKYLYDIARAAKLALGFVAGKSFCRLQRRCHGTLGG